MDKDKMELVEPTIEDKFRRPSGSKAELRKALGWPQEVPCGIDGGGAKAWADRGNGPGRESGTK